MTPHRWSQIEGLFLQAVGIPEGERDAFLSRACDGDAELRREVDSLLACDKPKSVLIESPYLADPPRAEFTEIEGRRIGPYRGSRLLGHGGMGSVILAVRDDDHFKKEVAIKLVKRGMDTDSMLARFRQERQILANLEHPFIARLLDGGATDDGLPYFVMEYVDGLPITRYCAEKDLDIAARLNVFRMVCEAIQYAHQNLVVHRDLKPGNILITKEGIPKLLDFGIAKVIRPDERQELQTVTEREARMMTPDYASPEQILGRPSTTSTDIYALGAVLYEILTRQRPHRFQSSSLAEMERVICEVEPERPSLAIRRIAEGAPRLQEMQSRQLSGDLDNIVLTAMRKDPLRRYPSVAELAEDLRRHSAGLPVTAQEDRWSYRAGKFIRRHRLGVLAACLLVTTLVGGIIATTYQSRRAERRFQLVRQMANTMLADLHPQLARLSGSTAVQLAMIKTVVQYLDALGQDSSGDPTLDFEVASAYFRVAGLEGGPTRQNLGQTTLAKEHYEKALAIFQQLTQKPATRDKAVVEIIQTNIELSGVLGALGDPKGARSRLERAAALNEELSSRGRLEISVPSQLSLYASLATDASQRGDLDAELKYSQKGVEVCEFWLKGGESAGALDSLRSAYLNLADAHSHRGNFEGARDNFEKALRVGEELARRPDAAYTQRFALASIHHLYGDVLGAADDPNLGDPAGALAHYRAAAEINEKTTAEDPQDVNARRNLSGSYRRIGLTLLQSNPKESLEIYRKAAAISERISAADPMNIQARSAFADTLLGEGAALHRLGRHAEALQHLRRVAELQKSIEKADPDRIWFLRTTTRVYLFMGEALLANGDASGALEAYNEGLATAERMLRHSPASLPHNLDRAEMWEALGKYYTTLAGKPGVPADTKASHKRAAAAWFEKSLSLWKDWLNRKLATSYARRRQQQTATMLASVNQP